MPLYSPLHCVYVLALLFQEHLMSVKFTCECIYLPIFCGNWLNRFLNDAFPCLLLIRYVFDPCLIVRKTEPSYIRLLLWPYFWAVESGPCWDGFLPHIRLFKNQWVTSQCSVHYSIYSLWISVPWIHVLISQYMLKGASAHLTEWQRAPSSIVTSLVRSVTIPLLTTLLSSSSRVWWRIHCHTWHIHKHVLGIYS